MKTSKPFLATNRPIAATTGGDFSGAGGGSGVSNVDARLRATFGERYALRIESDLGQGTTALMTVPYLRGEVAQRELAGSV